MSCFLYYFDEAPLGALGRKRGALTLYPLAVTVRMDKQVLTTRVVSITDGVSSEVLRERTAANTTRTLSRAPDGHPLLEGTWTNYDSTPF